jgi:dipeptidyl aminopeptidase/acylaminoacyl peptidase
MAGLIMALALAAAATPPAQVHEYRDVMISPDGARIAAIETDDAFASEADPHPVVVVRNRADGAILAKYDPCGTCFYAGVAWSPDSQALAFVASNRKARTASLERVRDGKIASLLDFGGLIETPRWSPDGQTLAVLATDRPRKISGATQAGAPIVGEIGGATDEARIATLPATPTSTSTTGRLTARPSWPPKPRATATTTGGSPGWPRSASTARSARSPIRACR